MKKILFISLAVVLALSVGLIGCTEPTPPEVLTIGISQLGSHPALDSAREGFKDAFKAGLEDAGLSETDVVFTERNAAFSMDVCYTIADYFVSLGVDLICAIATPNVIAAMTAVEGTDIPVVFNSVTNPADVGIEDWEEPGGQVTGASDMAPVEPQLQLILDIFADEANENQLNTLGVMYNPGEPNSAYQVDTQLADAIVALGLDIEVVEASVSTGADVAAAAETLAIAGVDAIWVPTDNTVVGAIEALVGPCEEYDIPLFAADVATVERGALGCWGMDYYDVGYSSGEMAVEILLKGVDPGTISIEIAPANLLYLYPEEAERQGVTIPQDLLDQATEIIED